VPVIGAVDEAGPVEAAAVGDSEAPERHPARVVIALKAMTRLHPMRRARAEIRTVVSGEQCMVPSMSG
jgi:hypothetical protein